MSTASLIVKFSSDGYAENIAKLQQLKSLGFEVQSSLAASAKRSAVDQVNAHVNVYREQQRLEKDWLSAKDQHLREIAAAERIQSDARLARMRQEAAEAKTIAKQEADAAKQAAREAKAAPTSAGGLNTGAVNVAAYLSIARQAYATFQQLYGVMADITNEAAKWEKFERALTDIEGSASVATRSLDDLYELAKRPGIGLEQANQIYLQFRALGIEGEKAKRMIVDFSNTVALSGGGATEFERINYQLVQMLSKGKVLEEDLRIMRNSMPRLTVLMREAFGATTAKDLRDRGIDAQKFVEGILAQMEKLPTATQTLESRIENSHTAWSRFKAALVDTAAVGYALDFLTNKLDALSKVQREGTGALSHNVIFNLLKTGTFTGAGAVEMRLNRNPTDRPGQLGGADETKTRKEGETFDAFIKRSNAPTPATPPTAAELKEVEKRESEKRKRYEAEGKKLLAVQKQLDELRIADEEKAREEAQKISDSQHEADLSAAQEQGAKLLAVQAAIDDARKREIEEANAARAKGRKELEEAERGEYANRFAEIDAWEKRLIENLRANEAEKTRIVAAANRKRTETYLSAYSDIAMNTSGFFGSMAAMSQQFDAENTRRYAAFVAVQQGLAIASATLNIAVAMSRALQSGFTTLDGLAQMGIVAAEGGKIINSITAMNAAKVGKGAFARGGSLGYGEWGIAGEEGAEIIEGPARITSTRETARALAGGTSLQVNVVNNAGAEVAVQEREDGSFDILLSKAVSAVEQRMTAGVLQGSSKFGKALQTTYQLKRHGT